MKPAHDHEALVAARLKDSLAVKQAFLSDQKSLKLVAEVARVMTEAMRRGGKVFFFGNGGSAADAQHLAAELAGRYLRERPGLPGLALTTNTSCLTAIGNDYGYDLVFARQLQAMASAGDIAIAISTSGNSASVLLAA
jgi:D-sedoheptulose 7-phosphate isomerase